MLLSYIFFLPALENDLTLSKRRDFLSLVFICKNVFAIYVPKVTYNNFESKKEHWAYKGQPP